MPPASEATGASTWGSSDRADRLADTPQANAARRAVAAVAAAVASPDSREAAEAAGLRFGDKGTHSSRTMMLEELSTLFAILPPNAHRADFARAVVDDNLLGKPTASTRRLTLQRMRELYALDPAVPVYRVLRHLWDRDPAGRPLLALLCALGRDPLLRASAPAVLGLAESRELMRSALLAELGAAVGERLNEASIDKVARNVGSTWTQSGHLDGRVRKVRRRVHATPGATAFALWLGSALGWRDRELLSTLWTLTLDRPEAAVLELAKEAKILKLITVNVGGGVIVIDARSLDQASLDPAVSRPGVGED